MPLSLWEKSLRAHRTEGARTYRLCASSWSLIDSSAVDYHKFVSVTLRCLEYLPWFVEAISSCLQNSSCVDKIVTSASWIRLPRHWCNKAQNAAKFLWISTKRQGVSLMYYTCFFFFFPDHVIKIWRLFPFAQEALAPLMTLYCHETPRLLTVAHHKLCAAFHEPATASYNIVVFKTTQKSK